MESKLISVVVPVYNAQSTLEKCVESILGQTYEKIQVVLVNDGSKDSSLDICRELADRHNNIKVIDKPNEGVSQTRNRGIEEADGEYILFVDSDDYIDSDMCETMLRRMEENNADVCMCAMTLHKNGESIVKPLEEQVLQSKENIAKKFISIYKTTYVNSPCNKLYKKKLIKKLFLKDISLGEDLLFNLDYLNECNKVVTVSNSFYHYQFVNGQSLTQKYRTDNFDIAARLYGAVTDYGRENGVTFQEMRPVREVFMRSIFYAIQDLFYYCKEDKKYKKKVLKEWADNAYVKETVRSVGNVSSQQKIIAGLLRRKLLFGVKEFFYVKEICSWIKALGGWK